MSERMVNCCWCYGLGRESERGQLKICRVCEGKRQVPDISDPVFVAARKEEIAQTIALNEKINRQVDDAYLRGARRRLYRARLGAKAERRQEFARSLTRCAFWLAYMRVFYECR